MDDLTLNRTAYDLILDEIPEKSRILDLGCGDGSLLEELSRLRRTDGYGVEISPEGVSTCVERGLYVYQGDVDDGLAGYRENSFNYVILNQTLHFTKRPTFVLAETMRICKNAIISFPNFANYRIRLHLLLRGKLPKNRMLPYDWHLSPNIHHLSIKDFREYCALKNYPIKRESHFTTGPGQKSRIVKTAANFYAEFAFFVLDGERFLS